MRCASSIGFSLLLSALENYSSQAVQRHQILQDEYLRSQSPLRIDFWRWEPLTVAPPPATLPLFWADLRLPLSFLKVSNLDESSDPVENGEGGEVVQRPLTGRLKLAARRPARWRPSFEVTAVQTARAARA